MANNRLYIRCKKCGKKMFIGKHFVGGWYIGDYNERYDKKFGEVMNEFHNEHLECFYEIFDNPYEIITEQDIYAEENEE